MKVFETNRNLIQGRGKQAQTDGRFVRCKDYLTAARR